MTSGRVDADARGAETVVDALAWWAEQTPDAPALSEGERAWSYRALYTDVGRVARRLAEHGVEAGDRVVVYLDRKSAHVIAYLAIMSLGAITVHVYPERPRSYVDFAAREVGARFVVTLDAWAAPNQPYAVVSYALADAPLHGPARHAVAYLMFTSGTTSTPKAVVTTQLNERTVTGNLIDMAAMTHGEREVVFMPLGSTGGSAHVHAALRLGNRVRLLAWFLGTFDDDDLDETLRAIERESATGILLTPALISRLLADHRPALKARCGSLRYMLANAHPMRRETILDLLETLPQLRFVTYYGLTEASRSIVNVCRASPGFEHATGHPWRGVDVRLDDVDPQTGVGQVMLRGDNVSPGYWGEDGLLDDARRWFATGDLARRDDDGRYWVLGRMDDLISIGGLKLMPSKLEAVLRLDPGIAECAVVAVPDPEMWHRVGAAVVPRDAALDAVGRAALVERLLARCGEHLSAFQLPRTIHIVDALPRNQFGKLLRRVLVDQLVERGA